MSSEADNAYLARRRDECLAKAQAASDPVIANLHREFAERYARAMSGGNPRDEVTENQPDAGTV
jgi:hypothetical protein